MDMDAMEQDGDTDIEANLLQQFSSMGTTDKEVLIADFQRLLGNQLNPMTCAFFLDMNNWNLQAGIGSYLDFEEPRLACAVWGSHEFDIDPVPPNTKCHRTFCVKNTGPERWPPGCSLKRRQGSELRSVDRVLVDNLSPQQKASVSIEITSPSRAGLYTEQWCMCSPTGIFFGEPVAVAITVADDAIADVTQQMSTLSSSNRLNHTDHCSNLLPPTICVDTIPVTSMSSMRINDGETAPSPGNAGNAPKTCAQITQNDYISTPVRHPPNATPTDGDDVEMVT